MAVFGNNSQASTNNLRAVTESVTKNSIQVKLNNGSTATGQISTVNAGFPTLNTDTSTYDAQKVMNVVNALVPCLTKSVYAVQHTTVANLVD